MSIRIQLECKIHFVIDIRIPSFCFRFDSNKEILSFIVNDFVYGYLQGLR